MSQDSPSLEIHLFGNPRLLLNGRVIDKIRRKNRALVYYLAAHGQPLTRENLLAFFWPDHERSAAQPILRTMIHDLRKQLGENFRADDQAIALDPDVDIDVHRFSAALQSSRKDLQSLTNALALYTGEFLEGFSLVDSPQFDDWAASEREHYSLLAMRGFADLARMHERLQEYPAALDAMRRALAFNPFQEDLQRELMRLLYLNGDRAGVIRQYETLRKLLDEEMGVPPLPETRSFYDSIINETFVTSVPQSISYTAPPTTDESLLPFIGREAELEMLKGHLEGGKLILLEGEPGIGKTRLASELIASQTHGKHAPLVLRGVAHELEQGLPYQPIVEALRSLFTSPEWKALSLQFELAPLWLTEIARLLPEILIHFPHVPSPTQPADESRLWEALLQFFRTLSRRRAVWLFLDDLHWADAATIGCLGYLIRHGSSSSLIFLSASRPIEEQINLVKLIQTLKRESQLMHFQLSELSTSAMQKMATVLSPEHDSQLSAWLIENGEGNPFFLTELVRYAYGIGLLKTDGSLDTELFSTSPAIPATIQNLIESRLLRLTENAHKIIHLAAIIGREFDVELLQSVASISESAALDAIEELQAAHLIRPLQGEKFTFDHSLTMQVSLQDINQARRHSLHKRVAESLESIHREQLDPISGLIATHFMNGNLPLRAASYFFRAGKYASNLAAWIEAISFYEQALVLERDNVKRAQILLAMGTARFHNGDFVFASRDFRTAVNLAQENKDWSMLEEAHLGLNLSLIPQARYAEAITLARELRESGSPELALCAEVMWGTGLSVESAHPVEAEFHLHEAERLFYQQAGYAGPITMAQITYQLAAVAGQLGRSLEAIDLYRKVLASIDRGEEKLDILRNIMLHNNLAYHMHLVGDLSASDTVREGIRLAKEKGSLSHLPYLYSTSGEIALAQKDLDAAEKYFTDGLSLAEQIPVPERIAGLTANLGLVARERGEKDLALQRLQTALNLSEQLGSHHLEVRIRIWLAPLLSFKEARSCLEKARDLAEKNGLASLLGEIAKLDQKLFNT